MVAATSRVVPSIQQPAWSRDGTAVLAKGETIGMEVRCQWRGMLNSDRQLNKRALVMSRTLTKHSVHSKAPSSTRMDRSGRVQPTMQLPVLVDGLRFRRGREVFRVNGVTYGPFAPGSDGTQFP